jgi:hypothetical protein
MDHLEAEAGVEGDIPLLGGLEVCGLSGLVNLREHRLQQRRPHPLTLPLGCCAESKEVPVRLGRVEPFHREQKFKGADGVGAEEEGSGGQQLEQLQDGMARPVGWAPQRSATEILGHVHVTVRHVVVPELGREEGVEAEVAAPAPGEHVIRYRVIVERPHQHARDGRNVGGRRKTNGRRAGTGLHAVGS